ncbi:MAG: hypothetical protein ACREFT_02660 [Acetobacteraceae bacterium]
MSHYLCRRLPFTTLALAVSALSRRMTARAAAAPLVAGRCLA